MTKGVLGIEEEERNNVQTVTQIKTRGGEVVITSQGSGEEALQLSLPSNPQRSPFIHITTRGEGYHFSVSYIRNSL